MKSKLFYQTAGRKRIIRLMFFFVLIFVFNNNLKAQVSVTVKFFIQGYYIGNNQMTPVLYNQCLGGGSSHPSCISSYPLTDVDVVTIELHDKNNYSLISGGTYSGRVHTDGTIACSFPSVPAESYYIAIKYQNALQTWSKFPVPLSSVSITYDFSLSANKAYGDNQTTDFYIHSDAFGNPNPAAGFGGVNGAVSADGAFKIYSGDISDAILGIPGSQDGIVESQDYLDIENTIYLLTGGFHFEDLNGDGGVDLIDFIIMERSVDFIYFAMMP